MPQFAQENCFTQGLFQTIIQMSWHLPQLMDTFFDIPVLVLLFLTLYFEVFILLTYFEDRKEFARTDPKKRMPGQCPSVTVIVPAWNEGKTIVGTVESLLSLNYPKDKLKIFIVDDGSTDDTLAFAKQFEGHPQVKIYANEKNSGKYVAMNLGIKMATTDLVGCLDADSFVDADALMHIIPYFDDVAVMAVTPSVQIYTPVSLLQKIQSVEYMIGAFTRKIFSRINGLYVTPGPFSIYRTSIFQTIGGFVHGYGTEDMEMALRMQANRLRIENAHDALVYTVSPATPRALYNQRVRWVSGFLKNAFFQYRHMFFSRSHGNLGMLTMPFAFFSIFIALFFSAMYVKNLANLAYEQVIKYSALGFNLGFSWPTFDWFSLNIGFQRLVVYMLFFATVFLIIMGTRMILQRYVLTRNMLYFILLYGLIAPFWLVRSLYNLVSAKEARWR